MLLVMKYTIFILNFVPCINSKPKLDVILKKNPKHVDSRLKP